VKKLLFYLFILYYIIIILQYEEDVKRSYDFKIKSKLLSSGNKLLVIPNLNLTHRAARHTLILWKCTKMPGGSYLRRIFVGEEKCTSRIFWRSWRTIGEMENGWRNRERLENWRTMREWENVLANWENWRMVGELPKKCGFLLLTYFKRLF
jgi:hypothetical protein